MKKIAKNVVVVPHTDQEPNEPKSAKAGRPRRRKPVRQRLFDAALSLFSTQGVEATTIDQIVEAADVAKGSFYNYFQDRNGIMAAIAADLRVLLEQGIGRLNEGIDDPAERMARGFRLYLALAVLEPGRASMLARLYEGGDKLIMKSNPGLLRDLKLGIEKGLFNVPSIEAAQHLVMGLALISMRHLLSHSAGEEILRGEGYARDITTLMMQGVGMDAHYISEVLARPFTITQLTLAI